MRGVRNRYLNSSHSKEANSLVTNCGSCDESGFARVYGIQNEHLDLTINRQIKFTRLPVTNA